MNDYYQHPTAIVEPDAIVGAQTRIWAYAHVQGRIGKHCNIGNYAFIEKGAVLGDQCTVKNGVQI